MSIELEVFEKMQKEICSLNYRISFLCKQLRDARKEIKGLQDEKSESKN